MKNIIFYFLIGIFLITPFSACEKLNVLPESSITDNVFWETDGQAESFINGIHFNLRNQQFNLAWLGEFRSGFYGEISPLLPFLPGAYDESMYNNLTPLAFMPGNFANMYVLINQCNLFIAKVEPNTKLNAQKKSYMLGQAYGLRAYCYFILIKSWGDAVLVTEPFEKVVIEELNIPASPVTEVLTQIKLDIDKSVDNFGSNYSFQLNRKSFWSKSATLMLKGEVYLWTSQRHNGGAADALIAENALTDIRTNVSTLSLNPSYKNVFAFNTKDNSDIIFTIRNELDNTNTWGGNNWLAWMPSRPSAEQWFDSVLSVQSEALGQPAVKINGVTHPTGTVNSYRGPVKRSLFNSMLNEDTRKWVSLQGTWSRIVNPVNPSIITYRLDGCYARKYGGYWDNAAGTRRLIDDYPIYRFSETLLMIAEAKHLQGKNISAEMNLVRARAYSTAYQQSVHGFPNQPGDGDIKEAILKERLFEFLFEGKRWHDLLRFGAPYITKYSTASMDKLLWPIPRTVLINNPALKQNPGY